MPWFCSVLDLRASIIHFIESPKHFEVGEHLKKTIAEKCFYLADGKATERIAAEIEKLIAESPVI